MCLRERERGYNRKKERVRVRVCGKESSFNRKNEREYVSERERERRYNSVCVC